MRDFIRLILLVLFLPLIIIFIGPFLVLAVVRGQQWMGPITLDAARHGAVGRISMLILGVAVWALVWSGLGWLAIEAISPVTALVQVASPTALAATNTPLPAAIATTTEPPTPTPDNTATPTEQPPSPTPTETSLLPTVTATPTATPSATATEPLNEAPATNTPTPEPEPTQTPTAAPTPTITPTPTLDIESFLRDRARQLRPTPVVNRQSLIATVDEGNQLLRNAIVNADEENLESLQTIWQGKALTVIEAFAIDLNQRFAQPVDVEFEYIEPPLVNDQSIPGQVIITTQENWSYGGPSQVTEEAFEFIYTLEPNDGEWVITRYAYQDLELPAATSVPTEE